ncbi:MAG: flap endonuclease-1 [Candidatus Aenigmarchaeota archaeon]|nr:flap endonuclease-1 [Candidatus Aenigmarchaeota archaeon]
MGIQLTSLVEGSEITLEDLFGKKIAIDSFNWLYQFLSIIRQADGAPLMDSRGRTTSHLSGLYYRTIKLLEAGVEPVYVFDGEPPEFKKKITEQRRNVRAEAMKEWTKALERKDYVSAKKYAQRAVTLTGEMIEQSKELLEALGVPALQAPSEGEAMCSTMAKQGDVYAVATQDYDSLLFGAPYLVRNLSITGRKKRGSEYVIVKPEMLVLNDILKKLGISRNQLIIIGMLIGTDYNPGGVAGFGPKRALETVKEKQSLEEVLKEVSWESEVPAEDIYNFFRTPQEAGYNIKSGEIDEEKIKKIMCDEHDFSEERVMSGLKKLIEAKSKDQKSLSKWF